MAKSTSNIDLVKPGVDEFYDVNIMNGNLDKIDSYTGEIKNKIYNGSIQNTNLQLGCNRIQIPEIPVSPKIEFTGFSYVNLLGRDGNCEDTSKWNTYNSILSLDTVNKVSGINCIKVIANPDYLSIANRTSVKNHIGGKKVLVSLYIKTNVTDSVYVRFSSIYGGGTGAYNKSSPLINTSTSMTRIGYKLDLSDSGANDLYFWVVRNAPKATEMYIDGIMANVISDVEYANVSVADLLTKYSYVDSYGCLTNPYFENRRYNLVRNGNGEEGIGYWTPYDSNASLSIVNGKMRVTSLSTTIGMGQVVNVKPNTTYYLTGKITSGTISGEVRVYTLRYTSYFYSLAGIGGGGTFNSGNNTKIIIYLMTCGAGYVDFDSIMLVEGTTAPSGYKSCDLQRFVVNGKFTEYDGVYIENGRVSGVLNWKHKDPLYGKYYDWKFSADNTGFKRVSINSAFQDMLSSWVNSWLIKYDGKIINKVGVSTDMIAGDYGYAYNNTVNLTVADTDSGWTESVYPNDDEVKAFMNGWKVTYGSGSRYLAWVSVIDGSVPEGAIKSKISATTSTTSLTVESGGAQFVSGDVVVVTSPTGMARGAWTVTGTPTATNIPLMNTANGIIIGDIVIKADSTTNTSLLTWCKNNVAPEYEGYRLHYKLINPESITDINVHVEGQIWDLVKGDNYVMVDSGIVLNEVANPIKNDFSNEYVINARNGIPSWSSGNSQLKNKVEYINTLYMNQNVDTRWQHGGYPEYYFGKDALFLTDGSSIFNPNAIYKVDYQILQTLYCQTFDSLSLSYPQSIISALESHSKALEQKQQRDSTLEYIVDNSIYEEMRRLYVVGRAVTIANGIQIPCYARPYPKKCMPVITVNFTSGTNICYLDSAGVSYTIPLSELRLTSGSFNYDRPVPFYILYIGSNSTIRNNLLNYGGYGFIDIIFDCRGRI